MSCPPFFKAPRFALAEVGIRKSRPPGSPEGPRHYDVMTDVKLPEGAAVEDLLDALVSLNLVLIVPVSSRGGTKNKGSTSSA